MESGLRRQPSTRSKPTQGGGVKFSSDEKDDDGTTPSRPARAPSRGMQRWRSISRLVGSSSAFSNTPIKVFVRVRPFIARELQARANRIVEQSTDKNHVILNRPQNSQLGVRAADTFVDKQFQGFFWSFDTDEELKKGGIGSQEDVFKVAVSPLVEGSFNGYDNTLIAYGSTGSGKSYTIFGGRARKFGPGPDFKTTKIVQTRGVVDFLAENILTRLAENKQLVPYDDESFTAQISFLEIYNEQIRDLLSPDQSGPLKLREYPNLGLYIEGLSKHPVETIEEFQELLTLGMKSRTVLRTRLSEESSRAHTIINIFMNLEKEEISEDLPELKEKSSDYRTSKLTVVDLAGTERSDEKSARRANVDRLKEAMAINKSLLALNRVIRELYSVRDKDKDKTKTFGHKDSILTRVLHESFGGNCRTTMIATLSPADTSFEQSSLTVQYADLAQHIINKPRVNRNSEFKALHVLHAEVSVLKRKLVEVRLNMKTLTATELVAAQILLEETQKQIHERELIIEELETPPEIREMRAKELHSKFISELHRLGVGVGEGESDEELRKTVPHLVQLTDDSGMGSLVYFLRPNKKLRFGSDSTSVEVVLFGVGIQAEHCSISNEFGSVKVTALSPDASVCVNGVTVTDSVELETGDRLVLGTTYFFRFVDPVDTGTASPNKAVKRSFTFSRARAVTLSQGTLPDALLEQQEARHRASANEDPMEDEEMEEEVDDEDEYEEALKELHHQDLGKLAEAFDADDSVPDKLVEHRQLVATMEADFKELTESLEKNRETWSPTRISEAESTLEVLAKSIEEEKEKLERFEAVVREQAVWETDIMNLLARAFPQVREANGYADVWEKPAKFELRLVPQIVQTSGNEFGRQIRGDVAIVYTSNETQLSNEWDYDRFSERLVVMRELYTEFMSTGKLPHVDRDLDPFYESPEVYRRIGQASISMQSLCYLFPVEGPVNVLANSGEIVCELDLTIKPIVMVYDSRGNASPLMSPRGAESPFDFGSQQSLTGGSESSLARGTPGGIHASARRRDSSRTPMKERGDSFSRRDSGGHKLNPTIDRLRGSASPASPRGRAMSFMENPDDLVSEKMDINIEIHGITNNNSVFQNGVFCRYRFWGMDEDVETTPSFDNTPNADVNHSTSVKINPVTSSFLDYLTNDMFMVDVFANAGTPDDTKQMMESVLHTHVEDEPVILDELPKPTPVVKVVPSIADLGTELDQSPTKILVPSVSQASSVELTPTHEVFRHDDDDAEAAAVRIQAHVRGRFARKEIAKRVEEDKKRRENERKKREKERREKEEKEEREKESESRRAEADAVHAELEQLRQKMRELENENQRLQLTSSADETVPSRRAGPRPNFVFLTPEARHAAKSGETSKTCSIV